MGAALKFVAATNFSHFREKFVAATFDDTRCQLLDVQLLATPGLSRDRDGT